MKKICAITIAIALAATFVVCSKPVTQQDLLPEGSQKTFECLVTGPEKGLAIMVNGIDTFHSTPSTIKVTAGDIVFTNGIYNGAWVVQGYEQYIKFSKKEFSKGYKLYVNVGQGKRFLGYAFKDFVTQQQFDKYVKTNVPLRVIAAFENPNISSLSALLSQPNLWALGLGGTEVSKINELAQLKELRALNLARTRVYDIQPLGGLVKLRMLVLSGDNISSIDALKNMKELRKLLLNNTGVEDISVLANLTSLEQLELSNTPVSSIEPLEELVNLKELDITRTQISRTKRGYLTRKLTNCRVKW